MTLPAKTNFGDYVRDTRERLKSKDRSFSLRQVAQRVGIQPTYLSKLERGELPPPSEETAKRIAVDLGLDADVLLAMSGKVSSELRAIICQRPQLFSKLIRQLKDLPDDAVLNIVREVTDGDW
ncbi:helix-turn-helix domain-containing protein [Spongiibacter marinus]|uniref:helix-turn-helix domain-containing protein n=1 Tax=Spongiibacter marinus TaxID=354246 RepID=UPI00048A41BF|nr:helix-turn-helix transcriptional regulator [Spongiibacter marinus]